MMFCVTAGAGTKPAGKGIDMDAVGNINGVPVYEFDLDGLKVEDKPWRKPGMLCSKTNDLHLPGFEIRVVLLLDGLV